MKKLPIISRGLILDIPARRLSVPYRVGDTVRYQFPSIYDPTGCSMGFGRVAPAIVQSIEAGVVKLRVLLNT